jgi:L-alanine-DL-glutamate epimerase-like enolase superfamily enzyme
MSTSATTRTLILERAAIRFAAPFRISGYVFESMPSVVATIEDGAVAGRGEAAGVYYLGDDQGRMFATIEELRPAIENRLTRFELQRMLPPCGGRNALDCALWELDSKMAGIPVWALAGVPEPQPLVTMFTLPADDPETLSAKLARLSFARAIKLKLDGDVEADRERLEIVRTARPDVDLSVDANQGFSEHDLEALAEMSRRNRVSLIEQPVRRGDEEKLLGWAPGIPVAADESILDLTELDQRGELFDVINIKLDKCGGLTEALEMAHRARRMGKKVMVGNMGGSTLAMAPGFVLGQLCDFIDLDGPYGLADDPLAKVIYHDDGTIFVPESIWGGA